MRSGCRLSWVLPGKLTAARGASTVPSQARFGPICTEVAVGKFQSVASRSATIAGGDWSDGCT